MARQKQCHKNQNREGWKIGSAKNRIKGVKRARGGNNELTETIA